MRIQKFGLADRLARALFFGPLQSYTNTTRTHEIWGMMQPLECPLGGPKGETKRSTPSGTASDALSLISSKFLENAKLKGMNSSRPAFFIIFLADFSLNRRNFFGSRSLIGKWKGFALNCWVVRSQEIVLLFSGGLGTFLRKVRTLLKGLNPSGRLQPLLVGFNPYWWVLTPSGGFQPLLVGFNRLEAFKFFWRV